MKCSTFKPSTSLRISAGELRSLNSAVVTGKGIFKVILLVTGWLMKKSHCDATNKELASLKRFCEEQPVPANA